MTLGQEEDKGCWTSWQWQPLFFVLYKIPSAPGLVSSFSDDRTEISSIDRVLLDIMAGHCSIVGLLLLVLYLGISHGEVTQGRCLCCCDVGKDLNLNAPNEILICCCSFTYIYTTHYTRKGSVQTKLCAAGTKTVTAQGLLKALEGGCSFETAQKPK